MLAQYFKFHIVNNTGVTIEFSADDANNTFTITSKPKKFNNGALAFHGSELTWFLDPTSDLSDGSSLEASAEVDNTSNLFLEADLVATLVTDAATDGTLDVYMEHSTDGGTTYPSDSPDFDPEMDLKHIGSLSLGTTTEDRAIPITIR